MWAFYYMSWNKLNTETFIERAQAVHFGKYDYSLAVYVSSKHLIKIICKKHGLFDQQAGSHLRGIGCSLCAGNKKYDTETFIEKATEVHGDRYDYSRVNYLKSNIKIQIMCKQHGSFNQTPAMHLSGQGCFQCGGKTKRTTDSFIQEAVVVHNNKYDYSTTEYISQQKPVSIICPQHGEFSQIAKSHLLGHGCIQCGGNMKVGLDDFVKRAHQIHNNKYDYSLSEYINSKEKMLIRCPVHGVFFQTPNTHLSGHGCAQCGHDNSGFNRTKFQKLVDNKGYGIVYIVRLYNESENFIKIGITTRSVKHRLCDFPYNAEILHEEIFIDGGEMFDMEKYLHRYFSDNKYEPLINFGGEFECFKDVEIDEILFEINRFKEKL